MPDTPTLPTLILGGWLGAGKTTLVNHLLRKANGLRIAVLVNDFGEVNLDAELIVGAEAGVLQLAGGCLCCSFGDDLVGTLRRVAARSPPPEYLLIELSGVALPRSVRGVLSLVGEVRLVGTLVLADAGRIMGLADDPYVGDTVRQQLSAADWLLATKTDQVSERRAAEVLQWLPLQAPTAHLLPGSASSLPAELILGWTAAPDVDGPDPTASAASRADEAPPRLPGFVRTPLSGAHAPFASRSIALPAGADLERWLRALDDVDWKVLRAKALVGDGNGRGRVLHWVAGRGEITPTQTSREGGHLVLIGLSEERLASLLDAVQ